MLTCSLVPVEAEPGLPHLDKLAHGVVYGVFGWLLLRALQAARLASGAYGLLSWIFAASYGLLMELLQALVPWRAAEWADVVMNAGGAALGVWVAHRFPAPGTVAR